MTGNTTTRWRRLRALATVVLAILLAAPVTAQPAAAATYVPISGAGSSWSFNAIDSWRKNVEQYGMVVNYNPSGSTTGRNEFRTNGIDFAGSDIPYGVKDGTNFDSPPTNRPFVYMPDTAGGTTFLYNLKIGARRVTNLRLSGPVIAGIFTGVITKWNDPRIAADNPGLTLPGISVVPVVRSDGSGATAQFTQWMIATNGSYWTRYCQRTGRTTCTQTSAYPVLPGSAMVAQSGDSGVSGYVSQAQSVGAIGYVEYSYAFVTGYPVAKVLNSAGYYTEPTPGHVAVSLLKARINQDRSDPTKYLTQDLSQVYTNPDPRTYPLSSYSYLILPTQTDANFTAAKGTTLGDFGKYLLCQGQRQVDNLGYSALPINLVQAGFDQLRKVPGANVPNINIKTCDNPTFSENGTNTLAATDPFPPSCDKHGPTQCTAGTGGAKNTSTPVKPSAQGGSGNSSSGSGPGGTNAAGDNKNGAAANAASNAAAAQQAACDPDSGTCGASGAAASGATGQEVDPIPLASAVSLGDGFQVFLMAMAAFLLLAVAVAPPLIAQFVGRRRDRRGGDS